MLHLTLFNLKCDYCCKYEYPPSSFSLFVPYIFSTIERKPSAEGESDQSAFCDIFCHHRVDAIIINKKV